jgi:dihydroxyacid dehydratase/phosphogluconate dehydratase
MLTGTFRGEALGCGTDVWRLSEEVRGGRITNGQFLQSESSMIRSKGHCNTMGTASTMAVVAEALGMTIPGFAGTPAPDSRLLALSHETGRLIVDMIREDQRDCRRRCGRRLDQLRRASPGHRRPSRHRFDARRLRRRRA